MYLYTIRVVFAAPLLRTCRGRSAAPNNIYRMTPPLIRSGRTGAHISVATTPRGATEVSAADLFEFDRTGYLVVKQMLLPDEVERLHAAVQALEADANERLSAMSVVAGRNYFADRGYHALVNAGRGSNTPGLYKVLVLEDFWNADPVFDMLVDHRPTLKFISALIQEDPRLNNSQIFLRCPGSTSNLHSGGWLGGNSHGSGSKYRYAVNQQGIDCMMVRVIYFTQRVRSEDGAFTVLPGSHKSAIRPSFDDASPHHPMDEPGAVVLETAPGDAIIFTESLRHGGMPVSSKTVRRSIHVGYGPFWQMSQNVTTFDQPPLVTDETFARYTPAQRQMLNAQLRQDLKAHL